MVAAGNNVRGSAVLGLALCSVPLARPGEPSPAGAVAADRAPGFALRAAKALIASRTAPAVINGAVVLVRDGRIVSVAGGYQAAGLERVGFNTDSPVVPGEELPLQAAASTRYGFDNSRLQALDGLTIIPAAVVGIDGRVGSLDPGKDADLIVPHQDPIDPRSVVERVFIEGRVVYDAEARGRRAW